eukprot:gene1531-1927_t
MNNNDIEFRTKILKRSIEQIQEIKFNQQLLELPKDPYTTVTDRTSFKGPAGIGKSHSLFQIVWQLRSDFNNRVIYIPDCGSWYTSGQPYLYFLDCCRVGLECAGDQFPVQVKTSDSKESFLVFLDYFDEHVKSHKLNVFFIFDQFERIPNQFKIEYPFSIAEGYLGMNSKRNKQMVIICRTPTTFLEIKPHFESPTYFKFYEGYSDTEFYNWMKIMESKSKFLIPKESISSFKSFTNSIPFELKYLYELWIKSPSSSLEGIFTNYRFQRTQDFSRFDTQFRRELSNDKISFSSYLKSIAHMQLSVPLITYNYILNDHLMYTLKVNEKIYIVPVYPATQEYFHFTYETSKEYQSILSEMYKKVFLGNYSINKEFREHIVGKYLLDQLSKINSLSSSIIFGYNVRKPINLKWNRIQYVYGSDFSLINWNINSLIIPNNKELDFLYWDTERKVIIAFKVDLNSMYTNNWQNSNFRKEILKSSSSQEDMFVWIRLFIPKIDHHNQLSLYISDLPEKDFNLLQFLI